MDKKLSALKRFESLSNSVCNPCSLSFLPDVRGENLVSQEDDLIVTSYNDESTILRMNKRKRNETIFDEECLYESPSKNIKLDEEDVEIIKNSEITIPTVKGEHSDLKYITTQTLKIILNGERACDKNVVIVDCRYPYEYEGGHIKGALNLYTREEINNTFILQNTRRSDSIIVFHCEFSSERGPKMCRFLRDQDRRVHSDCYPQLYYPEIYVLQGGYKSFYEQCAETLCEPQHYRPMIHPAFNTQLKHYRKETKKWMRSKSWSGTRTQSMANVTTTLSFEL